MTKFVTEQFIPSHVADGHFSPSTALTNGATQKHDG